MIKAFLHTGFEVKDLEQAIKLYEQFGFKVTRRFDKPEPKAVAAHLATASGAVIELWQFFDQQHPQVKFIRRHIAIESDDLEADIANFISQGCTLVIPVTKGVVLTYAFVQDPSGNNIEIAKR
jgi:catechol 2,3-dioxygenase-like lactoylglutathione lyase family enzyme